MSSTQADELARRADQVFDELLDLEPEAQAQHLQALAAGEPDLVVLVRRLLVAASTSSGDELERWQDAAVRFGAVDGSAPSADGGLGVGARLGAWHLVAPLARGGMSEVFVAERIEGGFQQRAALKLLSAAPGGHSDLALRFEQERQILASLEHPNVARVLDGGVAPDGRPFLVLELIEGDPIDVWCERHDLGVEARLELIREVARAVQHAHRSLIVHRDLKPSNVMVTSAGVVKLLDFGIAKVLEGSSAFSEVGFAAPETRTALRPLTPAYASPEQVRGGMISTASDIYQLGLLLYELLAGRPAHRFREDSWRELERVVCEAEPPRIASTTLTRPPATALKVPADLETIVFKALSKDPDRRYRSADELADDLERYLAGKPVLARPDTLVYRAVKFISRHRLGVGAAVALAASLVVGVSAAIVQGREAALQRDAAQREAARSERAFEFLLDVFEAADQEGAEAVTARELVARSAERLQRESRADGERAELAEVLAQAYGGLGLHGEAAALRGEIVELVRRAFGSESLETARALDEHGLSLVLAGRHAEAVAALEEALRLRTQLLGGLHQEVATSTSRLSYALGVRGEVQRSLALRRRALELRLDLHGREHPQVAQALNDLGRSLRFLGMFEEAEQHLREAIALRRRAGAEGALALSVPVLNLALVLLDRGELDAADAAATEALALAEQEIRPGHPRLAGRMQVLGAVRCAQGRYGEGEELLREAVARYRSSLHADHFSLAEAELVLADCLLRLGQSEEAQALATSAWERLRGAFHEDGFRVGQAAALLGACRAVNGDVAGGLALAEAGLAGIEAELGSESPLVARARRWIQLAKARGE